MAWNLGAVRAKKTKEHDLARVAKGSLFEVLLASVTDEFMNLSQSRGFKTLRDDEFRSLSASLVQVTRDAQKRGHPKLAFAADALLASMNEANSGKGETQQRFLMKRALDNFVATAQRTLAEVEERSQNATMAPNERAAILVIDDDAWEHEVIQRAVGNEHEVVAARSSKEALQLLHEMRPNLIILDVYMPGMSGTDLLVSLKDIPGVASIPVLMRSNVVADNDVVRSLVNGALDYLPKDIEKSELRTRVLDALQNGRSRQGAAK